MAIARGASQDEVGWLVRPTATAWPHVIDLEGNRHQTLGSEAVGAVGRGFGKRAPSVWSTHERILCSPLAELREFVERARALHCLPFHLAHHGIQALQLVRSQRTFSVAAKQFRELPVELHREVVLRDLLPVLAYRVAEASQGDFNSIAGPKRHLPDDLVGQCQPSVSLNHGYDLG